MYVLRLISKRVGLRGELYDADTGGRAVGRKGATLFFSPDCRAGSLSRILTIAETNTITSSKLLWSLTVGTMGQEPLSFRLITPS